MAEQKKEAPAKAAPADRPAAKVDQPVAKVVEARALESAAASSDPAVHQVLAEIQTARANGNDEEVERLTERLTGLGFE